jgi:excisionase family DNA binding protein
LKVDRITVYRMLQDGRLKGVKIGQQWRFPQREVDRMVGAVSPVVDAAQAAPDAGFPTHCVQTIQDLFAEVSQISALVVDMDGILLTKVSNPTDFCQMLFSTESGKNSCQGSWKGFARDSVTITGKNGEVIPGAKFFTCQAGLNYVGAPIYDEGSQVGLFLAGQFYWQAPDPREEAERIRRLASANELPMEDLLAAAQDIPVIDPSQHARVEAWPFTAARAVQSILHERHCFVERLQQIASLTQLS